MQAVYDSGETGWLLWSASNEYTEEALKPAVDAETGNEATTPASQ